MIDPVIIKNGLLQVNLTPLEDPCKNLNFIQINSNKMPKPGQPRQEEKGCQT